MTSRNPHHKLRSRLRNHTFDGIEYTIYTIRGSNSDSFCFQIEPQFGLVNGCMFACLTKFFLIKSAHPDFLKRLAAFFGWLYPYRLMAAKITVTFLIG